MPADLRLCIVILDGIGSEAENYGTHVNNGHVLQLAAGFPMETTLATMRLILSGTFDRHPTLKLLLAHSGGALPQLSSRLASCVEHDPVVQSRLQHDPRYCKFTSASAASSSLFADADVPVDF